MTPTREQLLVEALGQITDALTDTFEIVVEMLDSGDARLVHLSDSIRLLGEIMEGLNGMSSQNPRCA